MDAVLKKLSPLFNELYEEFGRPSIPPEQLLKSRILMALHSVRSERLFCEQHGYNLLWLWFLDRDPNEGPFDHSVFSRNYQRVMSTDVARRFFDEVYKLSREQGWTSNEHFTADGTLIESCTSLRSFVHNRMLKKCLFQQPVNVSSILSKTSNGPMIFVSDKSISFDRFKMSTVSRCLPIVSYSFSSLFSSTLPQRHQCPLFYLTIFPVGLDQVVI